MTAHPGSTEYKILQQNQEFNKKTSREMQKKWAM